MRRLAFLGTPDPAAVVLSALVDAGHDVALVVTRPDRRRGRGPATSPSPVKRAAQRLGLAVVDDLGALAGSGVDLGVVVAYGRLIPAALLAEVPMVNVHFSLLPRWRGAAPIERAILAGDETTGVTLMALDEGLDTGPVYAREAVAIGEHETAHELAGRLAEVGSALLVDLLAGPLPDPVAQEGEPTYAAKLTPAEFELDWTGRATDLARVVRLGRAWTRFRGKRLKVLAAAPVAGPGGPPGTLVGDVVACGSGGLGLLTVQPEGRRAMTAGEWLSGARPGEGERL